MIPLKDNEEVACFYVTKHSWRGKYKRILSVGTQGLTTYNPTSLEVTNKWLWNDIGRCSPRKESNDFTVTIRKPGGKTDTLRLSCDLRSELLAEILQFTTNPDERRSFVAEKICWSGDRHKVLLCISPTAVEQRNPSTFTILSRYSYHDIAGLFTVSDLPNGLVVATGAYGRLHAFVLTDGASAVNELRHLALDNALRNFGLQIKSLDKPVSLSDVKSQRLGELKDNPDDIEATFPAYKVSEARHAAGPARRRLCIGATRIAERDETTWTTVSARALKDLRLIIRDPKDARSFTLLVNWQAPRLYEAADRDALLATLLDAARSVGNSDVHVVSRMPAPNLQLLAVPPEESASLHMRHLQPGSARPLEQAIQALNASVPYSGLPTASVDERLIQGTFLTLAKAPLSSTGDLDLELEEQLLALRRLLATRAGFAAFTSVPGLREALGVKVAGALKKDRAPLTAATADVMCALVRPLHQGYDLRQEQLNKTAVLSSGSFLDAVLEAWQKHVNRGSGALAAAAVLDLLVYSLCPPYADTTPADRFDSLLASVATRAPVLLRLLQHPSPAVARNAALVTRALVEEAEPEAAVRVRALALSDAALPSHLLTALFHRETDGRALAQRHLSRQLVELWVADHPPAMALLQRTLPRGLLAFLESTDEAPIEAVPLEERDTLQMASAASGSTTLAPWLRAAERYAIATLQHWGARVGWDAERSAKLAECPVVLRRPRKRQRPRVNWPLMYSEFGRDHTRPDLIWNQQTREELRTALESELRTFVAERDSAGCAVAWNHEEFEVTYQCLADEVRVGDYFLRVLLDEDGVARVTEPATFFNELYHRFLLSSRPDMRCLCLRAMALVYAKYFEQVGPFPDSRSVVGMLDRCIDKGERDRLVLLLAALSQHPKNARDILAADGIRVLAELLTLAHGHAPRGPPPALHNALPASEGPAEDGNGEELREWYYGSEGGGRQGPVSLSEIQRLYTENTLVARSRVWAAGMDGWRPLAQVPPLKWTLIARGNAILDDFKLAETTLDTLISVLRHRPSRSNEGAVVRPPPRAARALAPLAHRIAQLMLTFEPQLVERAAGLLADLARDSPDASRLYLTGVFYFALMYPGSNLASIARLLNETHCIQAIRTADDDSIGRPSALRSLLPAAMLHVLDARGADAWARVFLGERDTPEVIWNADMRLMLMRRAAAHVADFSCRLRTNPMARYAWLPIATVRYPVLERELFCGAVYLRSLCSRRWARWPVPDPPGLLRAVLAAWRTETSRRPPDITVADALAALELQPGAEQDETTVRRAYYRLAQRLHPDKNPDGREAFEHVNRAYEFLCSLDSATTGGPSLDNLVLILRAQTILYQRYPRDLEPYKYAGYPQLVSTVEAETSLVPAPGKETSEGPTRLLGAACALAHHTVACSPLNAEELRREHGLEILLQALARCCALLPFPGTTESQTIVQRVCLSVVRCVTVAAGFPACRDRLLEMPRLVWDLCKMLRFNQHHKLCCASADCIAALSTDGIMQMQLLKAGALWPLLDLTLSYDATLVDDENTEGGEEGESEEATAEISDDEDEEDGVGAGKGPQQRANMLARLCAGALRGLGGYGGATPHNMLTTAALDAILTQHLAAMLDQEDPTQFLNTLVSNCETPLLIWNEGTRAELKEFLQQKLVASSSGPVDDNGCHCDADVDLEQAVRFVYSAHTKQLRVGGVYVEIYNKHPGFPLENPCSFARSLLEFLSDCVKSKDYNHQHIAAALNALCLVFTYSDSAAGCCALYILTLTSLLDISTEIMHLVYKCLVCATRARTVVDSFASVSSRALPSILLGLRHADTTIILATQDTLQAIVNHGSIVNEILIRGGVLYLLDLYMSSRDATAREGAALLLGRMCADRSAGPRIRLILARMLPDALVDSLRDEPPTSAVRLLDTDHENPELVWDESTRHSCTSNVGKLASMWETTQRTHPSMEWAAPEVMYMAQKGPGEMVVGGVHLRLLIVNPAWTLRRPKEFLAELLDACVREMEHGQGGDTEGQLIEAACAVLGAQPLLADAVPGTGHVPRLCKLLGGPGGVAPLRLLNKLALSDACVHALAHADVARPLARALQRPDMLEMACETLGRIYCSPGSDEEPLVRQALESGLVPAVLNLLTNSSGATTMAVGPGPSARAHLVNALKAMSRCRGVLGERVAAALDAAPSWAAFRDQRHDLFLEAAPSATAAIAAPGMGRLTQGAGMTAPSAPPPVDRDDRTAAMPALH